MIRDPLMWRKDVGGAAFLYVHDAGLSVIPIRADGSKAPYIPEWSTFQSERPSLGQIAAWYGGEPKGIAIIAGAVSGNLEVIDVDHPDAWEQWREKMLDSKEGDQSWRKQKFPLVLTPNGGRHLYYRLQSTPPGNSKLARWMVDGKKKTVIETRGNHGYVLAPGSPAACHPTGRTYELVNGDFRHIPIISEATRALFHDTARSLSQVEEEDRFFDPQPRVESGDRPGDIYNARADWGSLLRRHGWSLVRMRGKEGFWRRPGKTRGDHSATSNWNDTDYFYVFSSSADPFEMERGYTKFAAYALLEHNGDYVTAARELASRGFCSEQRPQPRPALPPSAPLLSRMEMRLSTLR